MPQLHITASAVRIGWRNWVPSLMDLQHVISCRRLVRTYHKILELYRYYMFGYLCHWPEDFGGLVSHLCQESSHQYLDL